MKIIDKYLVKNFFWTVLFVLFILAIISIVIDYTEKVDGFVNKHVPGAQIAGYYLVFIPYITAFLFPIFIFIAVIFFTTRLTAKSEVIAMLSSGMSYNRFLRPYLFCGIGFSLLLLVMNHTGIPLANKKRIGFENTYLVHKSKTTGLDRHFRISSNEYIYLKRYDPDINEGYVFSYEKIEKRRLLQKVTAESIKWDSAKKSWRMVNIIDRKLDTTKEVLIKLPTAMRKYNFDPTDLVEILEQKQAMTTKELLAFIAREKRKGNPALAMYEVEFHRRSGAPFSVLVLTIIGACMASFKVRGGSGLHLALGIVISGAYIIAMQFSTTFAIKGSLHPFISVWIPNVLFSILAFFIYKRYRG